MCIFSILFLFVIVIFTAGCTSNVTNNQYPAQSDNATPAYTQAYGVTTTPEWLRDQNIETAKTIVEEYHKTHTYSLPDMFVCAQMSQDVWDMVETRGINATIEVGSVDQNISSIQEADHAWVLAEVSPGEWIAVETTAGYLVCADPGICAVDNPRYYTGWSFNTPKALQDYLNNPPCSAGYVLGSDNLCHQSCGGSAYCTGNSVCVNGQCRGCNSGYVFGQDLQCHPACGGNNTYCTGNSSCVNGECNG
jgi:hypothetical protein